ncbi:MAG: response regulator [Fulvimarina manganoxydans]|nr:response regulator [Fulvimarina manganoxydans]
MNVETRKALAPVADDGLLLRMDGAAMLEDNGYAVVEAGDAAGALDILDGEPDVGLLFTENRMPGELDGIASANEFALRWQDIGIIVCSGRILPEVDDLLDGARFISKPCSPGLAALRVRAPSDAVETDRSGGEPDGGVF